jgi:hypothetical protein
MTEDDFGAAAIGERIISVLRGQIWELSILALADAMNEDTLVSLASKTPRLQLFPFGRAFGAAKCGTWLVVLAIFEDPVFATIRENRSYGHD